MRKKGNWPSSKWVLWKAGEIERRGYGDYIDPENLAEKWDSGMTKLPAYLYIFGPASQNSVHYKMDRAINAGLIPTVPKERNPKIRRKIPIEFVNELKETVSENTGFMGILFDCIKAAGYNMEENNGYRENGKSGKPKGNNAGGIDSEND